MSVAIKVENLGKQYRLGQIGTGTLSHDLNRRWAKIRGKEDPTINVDSTNRLNEVDGEYVWVLKNIDFEVQQGEVLGIIGKNGAGKSTLLKILSRVTGPSQGSVKVKGRIASLLEVGTGFHPELTGKENIFLNGAILGMSKTEIKSKFDEIVYFSGVGKYIETPVKRYSSGMYVRLAFAVAAHLEPEILIIDEVLAVGDAEFQKKCIGKMKSVAGEGRTVLFVSHNMAAVQSLCTRGMLLKDGESALMSDIHRCVAEYLKVGHMEMGYANLEQSRDRSGTRKIGKLTYIEARDENGECASVLKMGTSFSITLQFEIFTPESNLEIGFVFTNALGSNYGGFVNLWEGFKTDFKEGKHSVKIEIPYLYLLPGLYSITAWIKREGMGVDDQVAGCLEFEVVENNFLDTKTYFEKYKGLGVFTRSNWSLND